MTDFASLSSSLSLNLNFLVIVKVLILIAELIYGIFSFIVVRQVTLMNRTFQTDMGPLFSVLAYAHFFVVIAVFILTLILL